METKKKSRLKSGSPNLALKKLSILVEINQAISRTLDLKSSLEAILLILQKSYQFVGTVAEFKGLSYQISTRSREDHINH